MKLVLLALGVAACSIPRTTGPYVKSVVPYGPYGNELLVERCTLIIDGGSLREGECDKKVVPLASTATPAPRAAR